MSESECENCASLTAKCLKLEDEVSKLNRKFDHLLASLSFNTEDFGCQSTPIVHSVETQTENWICQSDQDQLRSVSEGVNLDSILHSNSAINASSDDALLDIFINANHDKTISTFQNAEVVPFIMLPYVQLLGHPFAQII